MGRGSEDGVLDGRLLCWKSRGEPQGVVIKGAGMVARARAALVGVVVRGGGGDVEGVLAGVVKRVYGCLMTRS